MDQLKSVINIQMLMVAAILLWKVHTVYYKSGRSEGVIFTKRKHYY